MDWLEHFEFGPGHLPFCFARPRMNPSLTPDQPDYWLNYWCAVYEHVADRRDARLFFVHHDELRADPAGQVAAVLDVLHAPADAAALATQIAPSGREGVDRSRYAPDLVARAEAVYQRLMDSPRTIRASGATARGTGAS
jgi:hypothetical protein